MHYLILRSHDEITRAGAKALVRMSHRGCCRGGPTAHPLVDLLPLLHPFFGHITTFTSFFGHIAKLTFFGPITRFSSSFGHITTFHPYLNISPLLIHICEHITTLISIYIGVNIFCPIVLVKH